MANEKTVQSTETEETTVAPVEANEVEETTVAPVETNEVEESVTETTVTETEETAGPQEEKKPKAKNPKAEATENVSSEATKETAKAAKSRKKKTSPVSGKKIISIDGELKAKTEDQEDAEIYLDLNESVKTKKALTGLVTGVEKQGKHIVALVFMGNYKVMIPAEEFIDIGDPGDRDKVKHTEYLLSRRIGSEIDFIVKAIDKEKGLAIASRKEAMVQKCKNMVVNAKPGQKALYEGAVVEARVVHTIRGGIVVEICGVETLIPSRELSYQRIQDATDAFSVGSRVVAHIEEIDESDAAAIPLENRGKIAGTEVKQNVRVRKEDGTTEKVEKTILVTLKASLKKAQKNPYEAAMKRYQLNQVYLGKVSMIDEHGVFVSLNGNVDVLCQFPARGERPTRGTKVSVRITLKNEEMNRIFGIISNVIK